MAETAETTPSKLDEVLTKIDALLAAPAAALEKAFTKEQFEAYVAEQVEASLTEAPEVMSKRLTALKAAIACAKASWDSGATTVKLVQVTDSWYLPPNTARAKEADLPSALPKAGDSNIQTTGDVLFVEKQAGGGFKPTPIFLALHALAKSAAAEPAPVAKVALAKSEDGRTLIAKAGEALAVLQKIASFFNVSLEDPDDILSCELRWQVSDMISALQSAARVESVIGQMAGAMGLAKDAGAAAPAAPASVAKAVGTADVAWPLDLASAELDETTGVFKDTRGRGGKKHRGWDESEKLDDAE
jgi:hypothetical protein